MSKEGWEEMKLNKPGWQKLKKRDSWQWAKHSTGVYAEAPAVARPSLISSYLLSPNTILLNSPFHSALTLFAFFWKTRDIVFSSNDNMLNMLTIRYYTLHLIILFIQHWPMSGKA